MITDLVKMYGPKTFLGVRSDLDSIEEALRYKSINRIMLFDDNLDSQPLVNRVLLEQQFLGEVEWMTGQPGDLFPKVIHKFDFIHLKEEYSYEDLVSAWKLCNYLLILHDVNAPVIKQFLDSGLKEGQTVRVTRYGDTIVIAR